MKFSPHEYQRYCIERILDADKLGLFLDMGLGKTVVTLTAVAELIYSRFAVRRCLVIAPKKVAEATWQTEAAKWTHLRHLRFSSILGTEQQRLRAVYAQADVYIVNRENVVWLVEKLHGGLGGSRPRQGVTERNEVEGGVALPSCGRTAPPKYDNTWPFDMVVIDESSSFKNGRSKRFRALAKVRPRIARLVELTGTPAPNGLADLWAQLFLLDGGQRLGRTVTAFRETFFRADTHGGHFTTYEETEGAAAEIQSRIGDICISMKAEDWLELPPIVYDTIPVELDERSRAAYREMEREMLLCIDEDVIDAGSAAALSNKLLQLCNGAVYDDAGKVVRLHDCKLEAFRELLERLGGQHVLVFYNFRHDIDRLLDVLKDRRVRVLRTAEDADAWNAGTVDVLLAHPASCAYGLNLQQGGSHVVWFGLNWSLELFQQANKRLHRQGQTATVFVHELAVTCGRDMDVIAALQDKDATQETLLESLKARVRQIREEETS